MTKDCAGCGRRFAATRRNQRFCTRRCREARNRQGQDTRARERSTHDARAAALRVLIAGVVAHRRVY
jgi:hypothetical protein